VEEYTITVENGTASVSQAEAGTTITITADAAPANQIFKEWTSEDGVTFTNAASATTTFILPSKNVTVTATYEDIETAISSIKESETKVYSETGKLILSSGGNAPFRITNLAGQTVKAGTINGIASIPVSSGIYLVKINGLIKKIIVK
jgi:hypothetical protein